MAPEEAPAVAPEEAPAVAPKGALMSLHTALEAALEGAGAACFKHA